MVSAVWDMVRDASAVSGCLGSDTSIAFLLAVVGVATLSDTVCRPLALIAFSNFGTNKRNFVAQADELT